jgi:Lrp/AsnC family leucine-responsive transcriptional regulator
MTSRTESSLDAVDWRILEVLQEDARCSYSKLGRRIGRSAPAVAERVRRMECAGIITGYRVLLALDKLGYAMSTAARLGYPMP